jgi:hypothetical protein
MLGLKAAALHQRIRFPDAEAVSASSKQRMRTDPRRATLRSEPLLSIVPVEIAG